MQKYGIVNGMNSVCSQRLSYSIPITKTNFSGDVRRAGARLLVCENGYRGVNRRAMGIG